MRTFSRYLAHSTLLFACSGCYHWVATTPYTSLPSRVHVLERNGTQLDGTLTKRTTDSVFIEMGGPAQTKAVAVGDIRSMEQREFGTGRSLIYAAGAALVGLFVVKNSHGSSSTGDGTTIRQ